MRKHGAGNISRHYSYHSTSPHGEGRERVCVCVCVCGGGGGRAGQGKARERAKKVTSDREEIGALVCAMCV